MKATAHSSPWPKGGTHESRTPRYKYIAYKDDPVELFFDMERDPDESVNLAPNPEFAAELYRHRAMVREWEEQMVYTAGVPRFFETWNTPASILDVAPSEGPASMDVTRISCDR